MPLDKDYYDENDLRTMGFKSVGKDVRVSKFAVIKYPEEVTIGNHVAIDQFVYISVKMDIGNRVHIPPFTGISGGKKSYCRFEDYTFCSEGCKIICGSDDYVGIGLPNPMIPDQYRVPVIYGQVILQRFSGIGANVTIFPNVTIEEGTLVGACSLVTKNLEPWGIYRGIPVTRVKERNKEEILKLVQELVEIDNPNIDRHFEEFVIVISITDDECYKLRFGKSLPRIGIPYTLLLVDPFLNFTDAYNSILRFKNLNKSKYIMFVAQDIEFLDENWGKKIVDYFNYPLFSDLGYAGVEAKSHANEPVNYFRYPNTQTDKPVQVETCDGAVAIIPTTLFLERQFDENFPWYPVMEDYALWVSKTKKLKIYSLPLKILSGCSGRLSRWVSQFASNTEYVDSLRIEYVKLLKKWGLARVNTTCN